MRTSKLACGVLVRCALAGMCGCIAGQSGTEGDRGVVCDVIEMRAVSPDEVTSVGTASALAEALGQPQTSPLRWYEHGADDIEAHETNLTLMLGAELASARHITRRDPNCQVEGLRSLSRLARDGRDDRLPAADGAFAEMPRGVISHDGATTHVTASFPAAQLLGSYDDSRIASIYVDPEYSVNIWLTPELNGNLSMSGEDPDPHPNSGVVSAAVADFP